MKLKQSSSYFIKPLIIVSLTIATAIFIISYCEIFAYFGDLAKDRLLHNPLLTFFVTPSFFLASAYICRKYEPTISGGSPQNVERALKQLATTPNSFKKIKQFVGFHTVIVNSISSLIATLGAGSLGREGPSVQMSSAIFASSAEKLKSFFPKINLESWILAGSGAGIALAFNAPIAGLIYVVEKLFQNGEIDYKRIFSNQKDQGDIKSHLVLTIITITTIAFLLNGFNPLLPIDIIDFSIHFSQLYIIIIIAFCCGISAFILRKSCSYFYHNISKIKSGIWFLIPITAGFCAAIINYHNGIYSFGGGIQTANEIISSNAHMISYQDVTARFVNTILTALGGCAGGLVAPSIAIATEIGSLASQFFHHMDDQLLMLCSISAFLSVILNRPITSAIAVLEICNQSIIGLPLMLLSSTIAFIMVPLLNKKL